jgi:hypothetical protein
MSSAQDRSRRAAGRQTLRERFARLGRSKADAKAGGDARETNGSEASLETLLRRVEHLELELQGLQDAVHRDSVRQNKRIEELIRSTQPDALARALGENARRRGI